MDSSFPGFEHLAKETQKTQFEEVLTESEFVRKLAREGKLTKELFEDLEDLLKNGEP